MFHSRNQTDTGPQRMRRVDSGWNQASEPLDRGNSVQGGDASVTGDLPQVSFRRSIECSPGLYAERAGIYLGPRLGREATEVVLGNLPAGQYFNQYETAHEDRIRAALKGKVEDNYFTEADICEATAVVSAWTAAETVDLVKPCGWAAMMIRSRAQTVAYLDDRPQEKLPNLNQKVTPIVDSICSHSIISDASPGISSMYSRRMARLMAGKGFDLRTIENSPSIERTLCDYIARSYHRFAELGVPNSLVGSHGDRFTPQIYEMIAEEVSSAFDSTTIVRSTVSEVLKGRFGDYDRAVGRALSNYASLLEEAMELFADIDPNHHWAVSAANEVLRCPSRTLEDVKRLFEKKAENRRQRKAQKLKVFAFESLLREDEIPRLAGRDVEEATDDLCHLAGVIAKRLIEQRGSALTERQSTREDLQQAAVLEGLQVLESNPSGTREIVARMMLAAKHEMTRYSRRGEWQQIQTGLRRENTEVELGRFQD